MAQIELKCNSVKVTVFWIVNPEDIGSTRYQYIGNNLLDHMASHIPKDSIIVSTIRTSHQQKKKTLCQL